MYKYNYPQIMRIINLKDLLVRVLWFDRKAVFAVAKLYLCAFVLYSVLSHSNIISF